MDHVKVVYCVQGAVLDVVTDLRVGSPTFGRSAVFELSSAKANSIYIPKGMAHGFCSLCDQSIMIYKVSSLYVPKQDAGILWNSVGVAWPTSQAILLGDMERVIASLCVDLESLENGQHFHQWIKNTLIFLLVLGGLFWLLTHLSQMQNASIVFNIKDLLSWLLAGLFASLFLFAI
jgi:hypothetical protein